MENYLINKKIMELSGKNYLDNESNATLFKQYYEDINNGIPLGQSEARTTLIIGNKRLIHLVLKRKFNIFNNEENFDEFSIGMIGLIRAIDNFDIDKGYLFSTYAAKVIYNEIAAHYRKLNTKSRQSDKNCVFFEDHIIKESEGTDISFEEVLGEPDEFIENFPKEQIKMKALQNLNYLTDKERECIIYFFGLFGHPKMIQKDIAEKMNIEQSYVSRLIKRGIYKLREACLSEEECGQIENKLDM